MKKKMSRLRDLCYRRRLLKWLTVNIRYSARRSIRFLKSKEFRKALVSSHAIIGYLSVVIIAIVGVSAVMFTKYVCPFFDSDKAIIRRLSLTEYDRSVPYLSTLEMLGSTNRVQVTLNTDNNSVFDIDDVGLDRGNLNFIVTFFDGEQTEYSLSNDNYDNFEAGMTDTFTIILPFGKTPFDISQCRLAIVPDVNNKFDDWSCKWARVYFLLGGKPVLIAKESWNSTALFGNGDNAIKQSSLDIVSQDSGSFNRANKLFNCFLKLKESGADEKEINTLKSDTLEAVGLSSGTVLNVSIETANIELQNKFLTYYAKGVDFLQNDSLDYDGKMYLDVTFYTRADDDGYVKSYELDTLGTDDFELGATSHFKLDMPEGKSIFDISKMSLRLQNPNDAWAPRFIRIYADTDYGERLEFARITDKILLDRHSTPIFYKTLIDSAIDIDLSSAFCLSQHQKKLLEDKNGYSFGERISSMYYNLQSFYDRQLYFFEQAVDIYTKNAVIMTDELSVSEVPEIA